MDWGEMEAVLWDIILTLRLHAPYTFYHLSSFLLSAFYPPSITFRRLSMDLEEEELKEEELGARRQCTGI